MKKKFKTPYEKEYYRLVKLMRRKMRKCKPEDYEAVRNYCKEILHYFRRTDNSNA